MANSVGSLPSQPVRSPSERQQSTAWVVLLAAFAAFCVLCVASGLGVRYFLLESTVPLQSVLTVGRGTAGLTSTDLIEQVVRSSREIPNSSVISTDRQSQATLSFYDPFQDAALVAAVTVRSDTVFDLDAMSRPRFDLSGLGYDVVLSEASGRLRVNIPEQIGRSVRLAVETINGNWITLSDSGDYLVDVSAGFDSVTNYRGAAALASADGSVTQFVAAGQRGLYYPFDGQVYVVPAPVGLIQTPTLTVDHVIESDGSPAQLLEPVWRCYSVANNDPQGAYQVLNTDGRIALNMLRGGGAQSHGETLCSYTMNAGQGVDVQEFDTLVLDINFMIRSHSLSACGVAGSECPLMVRVDYLPASGGPAASWFHGFFVSFDPGISNPLICASCTQEHETINANAWYRYQSDNLFSLIPASQRPASIVNVVLYASGHQYDVFVESAEMFGGYSDPLPPTIPEVAPIATLNP